MAMVVGVSWTMKWRWGKELARARARDAWPVEPPTWLGLDHGRGIMGERTSTTTAPSGREAQSKPLTRWSRLTPLLFPTAAM